MHGMEGLREIIGGRDVTGLDGAHRSFSIPYYFPVWGRKVTTYPALALYRGFKLAEKFDPICIKHLVTLNFKILH